MRHSGQRRKSCRPGRPDSANHASQDGWQAVRSWMSTDNGRSASTAESCGQVADPAAGGVGRTVRGRAAADCALPSARSPSRTSSRPPAPICRPNASSRPARPLPPSSTSRTLKNPERAQAHRLLAETIWSAESPRHKHDPENARRILANFAISQQLGVPVQGGGHPEDRPGGRLAGQCRAGGRGVRQGAGRPTPTDRPAVLQRLIEILLAAPKRDWDRIDGYIDQLLADGTGPAGHAAAGGAVEDAAAVRRGRHRGGQGPARERRGQARRPAVVASPAVLPGADPLPRRSSTRPPKGDCGPCRAACGAATRSMPRRAGCSAGSTTSRTARRSRCRSTTRSSARRPAASTGWPA